MQELESLLEKYWEGRISNPELLQLYQLLSENKEALNIDAGHLEAEISARITPQRSRTMLSSIHEAIGATPEKTSPRPVRSLFPPIAAAAAVIGIIVLGWYLLGTGSDASRPATAGPAAAPHTVSLSNPNSYPQQFKLEDGSLVLLQPGAAITYYRPFIDNRRDISLTGDALFTVAADRSKPFTVFADNFSTTALGTRFWVHSADKRKLNVQLLEGKVVVKASADQLTMRDIYLDPGQQFTIDLGSRTYAVNSFPASDSGRANSRRTDDAKGLLTFQDAPLATVFNRISSTYKTRIQFRQKDLQGLTFTGTLLQTDGLKTVLSAVCNMSGLTYKTEKEAVIVTKNK